MWWLAVEIVRLEWWGEPVWSCVRALKWSFSPVYLKLLTSSDNYDHYVFIGVTCLLHGRFDSLVVMRLTPRFFDSSFKALHQDPFHLLFQLFSDSAHPSREAASSFAALSSVAPCLVPSLLSWKYCMKYSIRVTREAMNSVTMDSHCGSSNQRYELEVSNSDILCTWKRCGQLNIPPLEIFAATSYYVFGKRREKTMEAASHTY